MSTPFESTIGTRGRIVTPTPPAPVPKPRKVEAPAADSGGSTPAADYSTLTTAPGAVAMSPPSPEGAIGESEGNTSDAQVVRSTGSMAVATLLSRVTGFIRTALIGAALGTATASAFNVANQLPNLITEIVLGSVLTSLVVPVLTRAGKEDPDRGALFIRKLFTLTFTLLLVVTVVATAAAPFLTRLQLGDGEVNVGLSTSFAYLLLPQIFFYGLFSLFMAILNTKEIFKPGAWAPVANNVVSIAVLLMYMVMPSSINAAATASVTDPQVMFLGIGVSLGVVVQCLIMVPALVKAKVDLRPAWGIDDRLKQFGGMAVAIIVYVAISQVGLTITNRIGAGADAAAPTIYNNAWLLLQVPYGIIGVALLTAIMPRMSRNAADGDDKAVVRDLTLATKLTLVALVPIIVFMMVFSNELAWGLFRYGAYGAEDANITGLAIAFSAFTLIPYALVMLHLRVFYAREEAWTPTFIIAGITATKIILSMAAPLVATSREHVVILLASANGFGFIAGAVIGMVLLRRKLGSLQGREVMKTITWSFAAALVGVAAALLVRWLARTFLPGLIDVFHSLPGFSSAGYLVELVIYGIVFLIVTGIVLAFSGLPEVQTLGGVLNRIPGMSRIITPDESKAIDVGDAEPQDLSTQLASQDLFNSSPVPPPMSAGVVRGPRLVPGAPVSDGRFRLLVDHGAVTGARFWQALEQSTGQHVALVFVDTSGQAPLAPRPPAEAARVAAEVGRNTRRLAKLEHLAIAPNVRVLGYRSGCLIVSDWVEGSPLRDVAKAALDPQDPTTLDPRAVAYALAPLANAAAEAEAAGTPLGLDNSSRLRVSTEGITVLQFPAVLPTASTPQDASGLASALELLAQATKTDSDEIDPELSKITIDARAVADESHDDQDDCDEDGISASNAKVRDLAHRLATFGRGTEHAEAVPDVDKDDQADPQPPVIPEHLTVATTRTPTPKDQAGFGARGYSGTGVAGIVGIAMVFVVLIAAASTYLAGWLSGDSEEAPVNTDSLSGQQSSAPDRPMPIIQPLADASVWQAPGQHPGADNPDDISYAIDGDTDTSWVSDSYPDGLGTKPGVGVAVTMEHTARLQHLVLQSPSAGARFSVYLLPEGTDPAAVADLSDLPRIMQGTLRSGHNSIDLTSTDASQDDDVVDTITTDTAEPEAPATADGDTISALEPGDGVILWFSELPEHHDEVELAEVQLVGINRPEDAAQVSEEVADPSSQQR